MSVSGDFPILLDNIRILIYCDSNNGGSTAYHIAIICKNANTYQQ